MESKKSLGWFNEARYGMFIHWGLYSLCAGEWEGREIPAIAEWVMYFARIPAATQRMLASRFHGRAFDPEAIADLACECGMKYVVFTAKHHEGFALFDTAYSDYKCTKSPFARDAVRELAQACRRRKLRFGLYYSQAQDWDEPDAYGNDWDFPPNDQKHFERYFRKKALPQVAELLTQYGPIDLLWFDTPMCMTQEQSLELRALVDSLQPDCLINGRIGNGLGDYRTTGDNMIPTRPIFSPWEIPGTVNGTFGFRKSDQRWKPAQDIIRKLVDINSKGGNYLLNIGPDGEGRIPAACQDTLRRVGAWLKVNGDSIYGTETVPLFPYHLEFGSATYKRAICGERPKLFLHILHWGRGYDDVDGELFLYGVKNRVLRAYPLADKSLELKTAQFSPTRSRNLHSMKVYLPCPEKPFDPIDSVICLELDGPLVLDTIDDDTAL